MYILKSVWKHLQTKPAKERFIHSLLPEGTVRGRGGIGETKEGGLVKEVLTYTDGYMGE